MAEYNATFANVYGEPNEGAPVRTYQTDRPTTAGYRYASASAVGGSLSAVDLPDGRTLVTMTPHGVGAVLHIVVEEVQPVADEPAALFEAGERVMLLPLGDRYDNAEGTVEGSYASPDGVDHCHVTLDDGTRSTWPASRLEAIESDMRAVRAFEPGDRVEEGVVVEVQALGGQTWARVLGDDGAEVCRNVADLVLVEEAVTPLEAAFALIDEATNHELDEVVVLGLAAETVDSLAERFAAYDAAVERSDA